MDKEFCLHVHSKRKRLADQEGISIKAVLDGIVRAGILPDDSAKFIKKVTFTQEKSKDEETILTFYSFDQAKEVIDNYLQ